MKNLKPFRLSKNHTGTNIFSHAGENNQSGYQHHIRIGNFQKPGDGNQQGHAQKSYQ